MPGGDGRRRGARSKKARKRADGKQSPTRDGEPRSRAGRRAKPDADLNARTRFAEFELDVAAGELRRAGSPVRIAAKPFAMLCYLVENSDRAVSKDELLRRLWPNVKVSDAAFASALKDLRRALGDARARPRFVRTVHGRGIRFVHETRGAPDGADESALEPVAARSHAALPTALVGRVRELRELIRSAEAAAEGRPRLVVIVGEGGTGKTRLVEELIRDPSCAGFALGRGSHQSDGSAPYQAFAEALHERLEAGDGDRDRLGSARASFDQLLDPGHVEPHVKWQAERLNGERARNAMFAEIWRGIERLARARPTLLVIEELQNASATALELLVSLAIDVSDSRVASDVPLLIVATTRPPLPGERLGLALHRLERQRGYRSIRLEAMGARATGELLEQLGGKHPSPALTRSVHESSGGNPYLTGLILRELGDASALDTSAIGAAHSPLARRLERLGNASRNVLTVAALIGDDFGLLTLGAASGRAPEDTVAALAEAHGLGLVTGGPRAFHFAHSLVRESLREATSEEQRFEIHLELAAVLEDLHASSPTEHAAEIAQHLIQAGGRADPARLMLFARRAGDQAFAVCAWQEAASFYEAVLGVRSRLAVTERAELHLQAGLACSHDSELERAQIHFQSSAHAFRTVGDELGAAWAFMFATRLGVSLSAIGSRTPDDLAWLETLFEKFGEGQPGLRGRLLETLSAAARIANDDTRAEDFADQALAVGSAIGDDVVCYYACEQLALTRFSSMRLREALAALLDARAYARAARDPWLQSLPGARIMFALQQLGRFDEARAAGREAESLARGAHNRTELGLILAQQGALELASGNLALADGHIDRALALSEFTHVGWSRLVAQVVRACGAVHRKRWNDADAALSELFEGSRAFAEAGSIGPLPAETLRQLLTAHRAPEEVDRELFASLVRRAGDPGVRGLLLGTHARLAEIAILTRALPESLVPEKGLDLARARGFVFAGPRLVLVSRLLAGIAALDGRLDQAESYFDEALRRARTSAARLELTHTLIDRASMQARQAPTARNLERARTDLSEAASIARELGLTYLEGAAAEVARELGSGPRRHTRDP